MDERTVVPPQHAATPEPEIIDRYRLGLDTALALTADSEGWSCGPQVSTGGPVGSEDWVDAGEGDGAAQAFVDLLRYESLPSVPGFRVVRLVPPPEATGERAVHLEHDEGAHTAVVVGERVVVTWTLRTADAEHPGPVTLEHLAAHDFIGVPDTYGLLLWETPTGHHVPVATASRYLPRSQDGRDWFPLVLRQAIAEVTGTPRGARSGQADLDWREVCGRVGRLVARLHVALATPSDVVPAPTARAGADELRCWRGTAEHAVQLAAEIVDADPTGSVAGLTADDLPALHDQVRTLDAVADQVSADGSSVMVQRVHGDLHVGRLLRWPGGYAVVGFDARPPRPGTPGVTRADLEHSGDLQPAARDVARLLTGVDEMARSLTGAAGGPAAARAAAAVREALLQAYRDDVASSAYPDVFDERLLAAFEAEQVCRDAAVVRTIDLATAESNGSSG